MEIHEIIAAALGFSKVISGQNYMYHESQEDSQNGAKSQVAEHLYLGTAANPKLKPILKFYNPIPCANPQLKIVQGNTPQGAELMSRLEFKTISFKAEKKTISGSAKYKTTLTAVPNTLEAYKGGRQWGCQSWEASSHKEWIVKCDSSASCRAALGGEAPPSSRAMILHWTRQTA